MSELMRYTEGDLDRHIRRVEERLGRVNTVSRVVMRTPTGDVVLPVVDVVRSDEFGTVVYVQGAAAGASVSPARQEAQNEESGVSDLHDAVRAVDAVSVDRAPVAVSPAPPEPPRPELPAQWDCPHCGYGEYMNRADWNHRMVDHLAICPYVPCTCSPPEFANQEHDSDCPRGIYGAAPAPPPEAP